ncbi:hypothetical protein D3C76_1377230 [compost metagenome]
MRVIGVALHERVTERQCQAAQRQPNGRGIGAQHQQETHAHQQCEEYQCLFGADLAAHQRPLLGTLHMTIDLAVRPVVDHAAASASQYHAKDENHNVGQGGRTLAGNP